MSTTRERATTGADAARPLELRCAFTRGATRFDFELSTDASVLGVFGPSGSGKTSLLHAMAGLIPSDTCRLRIGERVVVDQDAGVIPATCRRRIALCFQEPRLLPHRDVGANLRYGERLVPRGMRRIAFADAVDLLDLGQLLTRRPAQLSGGERQRVALGRALLCSPRLLACDEPFTGLDRGRKRELLRYLRRVPELLRAPLLVVSHDLADLLQLGEHLALVDGGRITACGRLSTLVRDPELLPLLHDLGLLSTLRGEVLAAEPERLTLDLGAGIKLRVSPGPAAVGDVVTAALRPDDVGIATAPLKGTSFRNQLVARVKFVTRSPARCLVGLAVGEAELLAQVSPQAITELGLEPGVRCVALIKAEAVHLL